MFKQALAYHRSFLLPLCSVFSALEVSSNQPWTVYMTVWRIPLSLYSELSVKCNINSTVLDCLKSLLYQVWRKGWGHGELARLYQGYCVTKRGHWWPEYGSSYSPGAVDMDYSLSPPKTICAWWRAPTYEWWPCCAEHNRSKGVNLEKQSPILWCECHA